MKRVFVTGIGAISALGRHVPDILTSLLEERTGIGPIRHLDTIHADTIPAAEVPYSDADLLHICGLTHGHGLTRNSLIALIAAREALASAGISDVRSARTGFISATTAGGMREFEQYFYQLQDLTLQGQFTQYADTIDSSEHTERVARLIGIRDFITTVSTACSSSANGIILGAQLIRHGLLDRVVCGGADAFCKFTLNGFNALMILDRAHCRPFDQTRSGLNLGEAAAFVVLESEAQACRGDRYLYGELSGYSNTNDAFHQTASSPDGRGAIMGMRAAIDMAGMTPAHIDYINAHGTATENNDLSEGMAIERLFEGLTPRFSSTKSYTGHTLAAAGSLEAIFGLLAIREGIVFPNLNFKQQMDEITISPVQHLTRGLDINTIMSNSFGFGGSNTSLIFSKVKDQQI